MKHTLTRAWALIALAVMYLTNSGAVQAQSTAVKANVPFAFYVGDQKLPAGQYRLTQPMPGVLYVAGDEGSIQILSIPADNRDGKTMLIFTKYGTDQLFLSEVRWTDGARKIPQSRSELELAKTVTPERVIAAATNR